MFLKLRKFSSFGSERASEIREAQAADNLPSATIWRTLLLFISSAENFCFGCDSNKAMSSFHNIFFF